MSFGRSIGRIYAPDFDSEESKVEDGRSTLVLEDGGDGSKVGSVGGTVDVAGGRERRGGSKGASSVTAGDDGVSGTSSFDSNVAICAMLCTQDPSSTQMDLQEPSRASLFGGDVIAITTICAE